MDKAYKLVHKRFIELSADTHEKVYCTKLLGFFSSPQKCKDIIDYYLQKPGFKDFPNDFQKEAVYADTDEFNNSIGEFKDSVFYLAHEYFDGEYDNVSDLGYYSTYENARKSLSKYHEKPEFKNYPDGFCIDEYKIDKPEWTDGFFTY